MSFAGRGRALLLAFFASPLVACSSQPTPVPAQRTSALASFARAGEEVAALLRRPRRAPRVGARGVVVETRALTTELRSDGVIGVHPAGGGSLAFRVEGVAASAGGVRVEDDAAVIDGAAQTLVFDRGAAIEVLHRLPARAPLAYALELPAGAALRGAGEPGAEFVEVVDAAGVPRARLTADAAWDREGRRLPVHLRVDAARARVSVELPDDAAYPVVVDPAWSATSQPTRLRMGHATTLLGTGEVLLTGGGSASAEVFDVVTGRFRAVGSMSMERRGHATALLPDGTVLVAGGYGTGTTEIYDPVARTFSAGPSMNALSGQVWLARLRSGEVLASSRDEAVATVERFDPKTRAWTSLTRAAGTVSPPVPLASGDVLYVGHGVAQVYQASSGTFSSLTIAADVGGTDVAAPFQAGGALFAGATAVMSTGGTSVFYVLGAWTYDPTSQAFTRRPDVAFPSTGAFGLTLPSGKVLYVGTKAQSYDPATNTWSAADTLPSDHVGGAATVLPNGTVLVTGGNSGAATVYLGADPAGPGAFTNTGSMTVGRIGGALTRLLDGRALMVGGAGPAATPDARSTAEVWSDVTGAWTGLALRADRVNHAQALLPSGKVLIAGGGSLSSAEIFDPSTGTTTATGSLSQARDGASATALPSGKVLIAGGSGTSTAELFDEAKGTFTAVTSTMRAAHGGHGAVLLPSGKVLLVDGTVSELFDPITETFSAGPPLSVARDGRTASLLPSGDVVVGGRSLTLPLERFDAASASFVLSGTMTSSYRGQSAAPLPFGRVLFGFGVDVSSDSTRPEAWIYDALGDGARGATAPNAPAGIARRETRIVQLARGGLLIAGGDGCADGCFADPSRETAVYEPFAPPLAARPAITKVPATIVPGASFDVEGARLVGTRETASTSSGRLPIFAFVPASGQGSVIATTLSFTDTTAKVRLPATAFRGKGFLHAAVAGVTGPGALVDLGAAANGTTCAAGADCDSGFCVDGVCCDGACQGVCLACTKARKGSGADGVCGAIPPEKDPNDACAAYQGAGCTSDAQCASGICSDGVCCDARCAGQCESCRVEGSVGTCVPVLGAPASGHAACDAGTDACSARRCDGKARTSCDGFAPSTTSCRVDACKDGVATIAASCDGLGACPAVVTKSCEPFACGDTACLTRCTANSECASGYRCAAGKCVTGAFCATDHLLQTPGAADVDCSPYLCEGDHCKTTCVSSAECVGGYLCSEGSCVPAAPAATGDSGGCATSAAPGTAAGSVSAIAALALLGLLSRARRAPR
jgi:WD40 repeat protein